VGPAERNTIIYKKEMSRSEKAMFKAEEALKKVEAEWSVVEKEEQAAWSIVWSFEKAWNVEHPDQKGGWWRDKRFLIAEKMAMTKNMTRHAMEKNLRKAKTFFELKQRQWQDFLVRDEKRIKHCSCGERDNSRMVLCDECFHWVHLSCANLTEEEAVALPMYECSACFSKYQAKAIASVMEDFIRHQAGEIDSDGNEVLDKEE
jgi:PHD-finger